jgi:hypothetical protein
MQKKSFLDCFPTHAVVPNVWKGFLNSSPLKRKRFEPMQE